MRLFGAVHSVVFAGFSSNALADRINDSQCVCVLTSDGMYRGAKALPVKKTVDEALKNCTSVESVIVVKRDGREVEMVEGRDHWYAEAAAEVSADCAPEPMDAEDMLFILYTSGSTVSLRVSFTHVVDIWSMQLTASRMSSNTSAAMCTGVRPMWVGLRATATSSTDRY